MITPQPTDQSSDQSSVLPPIRLAARTSPLARAQVELVGARLVELGARWTFVGVTTTGDVDQRDLTQIGGTGVFVTGVRQALLDGRADVAVHSLKDLPTAPSPGLTIAAVPEREDPADVLVGRRLAELRSGDRVGTGAPRRADQLRAWAAARGVDLDVVAVRGNVGTRVGYVRDQKLEAVVLAAAGLRRLGRLTAAEGSDALLVDGLVAERLPADVVLSAPGQGALGLECAESLDSRIRALMTRLDHGATRAEVLAERAFLRVLEAGCTAPVGARAIVGSGPSDLRSSQQPSDPDLSLDVVVGTTWTRDAAPEASTVLRPPSDPGAELLRMSSTGLASRAEEVGAELASAALLRLSR